MRFPDQRMISLLRSKLDGQEVNSIPPARRPFLLHHSTPYLAADSRSIISNGRCREVLARDGFLRPRREYLGVAHRINGLSHHDEINSAIDQSLCAFFRPIDDRLFVHIE